MRKAFNFYRSYYEVAMELKEKEFVSFIKALLQKQFEGIEPNGLIGNAKLAYIGQKFSIDSQVIGYEGKTGIKLTPTEGGTQGGSEGGSEGGSVQEKEKEEEQYVIETYGEKFKDVFDLWFDYKRKRKEPYKNIMSRKQLYKKLYQLSNNDTNKALKIIEQSMANNYAGIFDVKESTPKQVKLNWKGEPCE
jgi:hypothetical protein